MEKETKWAIDPVHSEIAFKIKHLMITHVKGSFKTFDADISTMGDDFTTAQISVWIDPTSVNTGDEKRDEHLKTADFFDVSAHKEISFSVGNIEKTPKTGNWELWGNLTMKGISKKIKLDVEYNGKMKDPWGNEKAGFIVTGKINRKDWDIAWNTALEAGGFMLGEEVIINCEVQLIKKNKQEMEMRAEVSDEKATA